MKYIIASLSVFMMALSIGKAQPNIEYWDHDGYFKMGGGMVIPGDYLSDQTENGLFAKNGYQVNFDYNYIFGYGLGLGGNIEYDHFQFNDEAFLSFAQPDFINVKGGYSSTKFGLNFLMNIPIEFGSDDFVANLYGEFNAGVRTFSIPDIDLEYNEIVNKYVEVTYRSRNNTMGYLGYSAGLQFLFNNKFGINLSYNAVLPSRHSIKYSVRMYDAQEELYEEENYLNNFLDHSGYQLGILFIFGKK